MKTTPRHFLFGATFACSVALTAVLFAEDATAPVSDKQAAPTPAAAATTSSVSPAPTASATASTAATATPAATAASTTSSVEPSAAPAPTSAEARKVEDETPNDPALRRIDNGSESDKKPARSPRLRGPRIRHGDNARVSIVNNASLGKGETADSVVAICGNATSEGEVADAVVAVCGNARATGPVGDSVVAVLGNVYVDAKVGEAVAVFGNVELGPNADVAGDVVTVFGTVKRDPKAVVHGSIPNVTFGGIHVSNAEWLQAYLAECVFKLRPLAIAPHLGWAWSIAVGFLVFYVLLALLFRGGIETCVQTLESRPGSSILAALLTLLLTPVLFVLLAVTGIGIAVIPFLGIALLCATLVGKVTMLAWLGRRITRYFGEGPMAHVAVATLLGGLIVLALYLIPVAGFIVYKLLGMLGVGVVVYTVLLKSKRERPVPVAAAVAPVAVAPVAESVVGGAATIGGLAVATAPAAAVTPPVAASTLPRAGFWVRFGASLIDLVVAVVVIGVLSGVVSHHLQPQVFFLLLAAYAAVMWKTKGTTIGGIVCGLRVIRLDGAPVDWATAIVRALSAFVSILPLGLGFIWVVIDDEKQSWHDKIAGTTIVCVRGNISLV